MTQIVIMIPRRKRGLREETKTKNRLFSALISNLEHALILAHDSFGNRPRFPVFLPWHKSPDHALNRRTRLLFPPDRKFSLEKRGGYCTEHLAMRECLRPNLGCKNQADQREAQVGQQRLKRDLTRMIGFRLRFLLARVVSNGNLLIRTQPLLAFWARMHTDPRRPSNKLVKAPAKSKTERRIRDTDKTGPSRTQRSLQ